MALTESADIGVSELINHRVILRDRPPTCPIHERLSFGIVDKSDSS